MTEPESAVEKARASVASMRAKGAYGERFERAEPPRAEATGDRLLRWALIEPDLRDVRSTRRLGRPMTAVKRLLVRLLDQYHAELISQQTRFNVSVLKQLEHLEQRLERLERYYDAADRRP